MVVDWQCRLVIQVQSGRLDRVSWRDIWATMVAMVEMCAKHGKIATVSGFGKWRFPLPPLYFVGYSKNELRNWPSIGNG